MAEENASKAFDHLSDNQMREYKSVFELIKQRREDKNHLTYHELAHAMRMLGLNPKEEEIQEIINTIDIEGGGNIEFEDFVTRMEHQRIPDEGEALRQAFYVFDADNRGFIDSEDLRDVMQYMKIDKEVDERELQEMLQYLGIDVDRRIPYEEFRSFISANIHLENIEEYLKDARESTDEDGETKEIQEIHEIQEPGTMASATEDHEIDGNQNFELGSMEQGTAERGAEKPLSSSTHRISSVV